MSAPTDDVTEETAELLRVDELGLDEPCGPSTRRVAEVLAEHGLGFHRIEAGDGVEYWTVAADTSPDGTLGLRVEVMRFDRPTLVQHRALAISEPISAPLEVAS